MNLIISELFLALLEVLGLGLKSSGKSPEESKRIRSKQTWTWIRLVETSQKLLGSKNYWMIKHGEHRNKSKSSKTWLPRKLPKLVYKLHSLKQTYRRSAELSSS